MINTTYKTTRDFNTTGRNTNLRLHTITAENGATLELLQSYNQIVAYKNFSGEYFRTDKTTAKPRWSVTTARHVNSYLQGREAEVVEQSVVNEILNMNIRIYTDYYKGKYLKHYVYGW